MFDFISKPLLPFFANKCQETERVNRTGTAIAPMLRTTFQSSPGVDQGGIKE